MSDAPTPPESHVAPEVRNPAGWIALAVLLLYTLAMLLKGVAAGGARDVDARRLEAVRTATVAGELGRLSPTFAPAARTAFERLERDAAPSRHKDPEAAAVWAAARSELREPVRPDDLRPALASSREDLRLVAQAYALRPAPKARASEIAAALDARGPLSRLAAVHLREAAGLPGAHGPAQGALRRYLAALALFGVAGLGSLVAWAILAIVVSTGNVPDLGPPLVATTPGTADGLAARAAALFAGFEVASIAVRTLGLPAWLATTLAAGSMFAVVPLVLRRRPSFEEVVGAQRFLGRKILLGLWAFGLEIPVTLLAAAAGSALFRGLPTNEHPAAVALMNTRDILTIASLLFAGAVVAPFWEETMFRGLLFPALRRVLGGPLTGGLVPAALVSSFLFACIHPQGPGGWIGLMAFALCSCVLTVRTRSLVPSMVMHAVHNATLLAIAILMGG